LGVQESAEADQGEAHSEVPEEAGGLHHQRPFVTPCGSLLGGHLPLSLDLRRQEVRRERACHGCVSVELYLRADVPDQEPYQAEAEEARAGNDEKGDGGGGGPAANGERVQDGLR
jgi:hypothetical protein